MEQRYSVRSEAKEICFNENLAIELDGNIHLYHVRGKEKIKN